MLNEIIKFMGTTLFAQICAYIDFICLKLNKLISINVFQYQMEITYLQRIPIRSLL